MGLSFFQPFNLLHKCDMLTFLQGWIIEQVEMDPDIIVFYQLKLKTYFDSPLSFLVHKVGL